VKTLKAKSDKRGAQQHKPGATATGVKGIGEKEKKVQLNSQAIKKARGQSRAGPRSAGGIRKEENEEKWGNMKGQ